MALALKKRLESGGDDLQSLIADVRDLRREVAAVLRRGRPHLLERGRDRASDMVDEIGDRASDLYASATRRGNRAMRILNRQFREQPAMSVIVAVGIGVLISSLARAARD